MNFIWNFIQNRREALFHVLDLESVWIPELSIYLGTVLGKDALSGDQRILFSQYGLLHLITPSALHFGILIFFIDRIFSFLERFFLKEISQPIRILSLLTFSGYYWLITGLKESTTRALFIVALLKFCSFKKYHYPFRIIFVFSYALILILEFLFKKNHTPSLSSIYSFSALSGICISTHLSKNFLKNMGKKGTALISTTIIWIFLIPANLYSSQPISFYSIPLNFLSIPLFSVCIIPQAIISSYLASISPLIAKLIFYTSLPFILTFQVILKQIEFITLFGCTSLFSYFFCPLSKSSIYFLMIVFLITPIALDHKPLSVSFLYVGQGDATLISQPSCQILIDTGPRGSLREKRSLLKTPVSLIITHPHADHYGELKRLFISNQIKEVIFTKNSFAHSGFYRMFNFLWESQRRLPKVPITLLKEREGYFNRCGLKFHYFQFLGDSDPNSASPLLEVALKNTHLLLTGDLPEKNIPLHSNSLFCQKDGILKVSHHGAKNALNSHLSRCFRPRYSVISVGEKNRYHHPHSKTLRLLKTISSHILRTDQLGDVVFSGDEEGFLSYQH